MPPEPNSARADVLDRLTELVRERRAALIAIARAEGVTPEDALDCVHEALCTFLDAEGRGAVPDDAGAWPAWLAVTVRNAARNRRRRHFRSMPHDDVAAVPLVSPDAVAADDLIARAEDHVRLRACVESLCEIQRAVVTLRLLEEQPGEDVAQSLGIARGHVAVLLHRAKASLRACMAERDEGGDRE